MARVKDREARAASFVLTREASHFLLNRQMIGARWPIRPARRAKQGGMGLVCGGRLKAPRAPGSESGRRQQAGGPTTKIRIIVHAPGFVKQAGMAEASLQSGHSAGKGEDGSSIAGRFDWGGGKKSAALSPCNAIIQESPIRMHSTRTHGAGRRSTSLRPFDAFKGLKGEGDLDIFRQDMPNAAMSGPIAPDREKPGATADPGSSMRRQMQLCPGPKIPR